MAENDESDARKGAPLRPRARIMRALGQDLISSEHVAVLELVKNAYDADARTVTVRFLGSLVEGDGCIEIEDDGVGMSPKTVRSAWMEPGTATKKAKTESPLLGRRVLGEKGLGRFASAKLADTLEMLTRRYDSSIETRAYFDWTQFDDDSLFLDEVDLTVEERKPGHFRRRKNLNRLGSNPLPLDGSHGTLLRMAPLKRAWGERDFRDLDWALSRLVFSKDQSESFRIFTERPANDSPVKHEVSPPETLKHPHYAAEAIMLDDGAFTIDMEALGAGLHRESTGWYRRVPDADMDIRDLPRKEDLKGTYAPKCGPLKVSIKAWDRDDLGGIRDRLGVTINSIKKDIDAISGINIYRDDFRVLPYGEPDNDWLRLDARRVNTPSRRFSNNQISGLIRISADENPLLYDQSNREGLTDNDAFADLSAIVRLILFELEQVRTEARRKPEKSGGGKSRDPLFAPPEMDRLRTELKNDGASRETIRLLDDKTREWERQVDRIGRVLSQYHSLATLGGLVDKIVHEARQPLSTIDAQATLLGNRIRKWKRRESELSEECLEAVDRAGEKVDRILDAERLMHEVISRVEPFGGRRRGKPSKVYIDEIVRTSFSHFQSDLNELGVSVELPEESFLVTVDRAELQEVFINLLSNSVYWLRQVPKGRRAIRVVCNRPTEGVLEIVFSDSGPGIPARNREDVFRPYFSTKEGGVGLGLVIVGEIVKDFYDGSLEILDDGPLSGATFRLTLRKRV